MRTNLLSPKAHGVLDYALATSLLVLPSLFGFSRKVRKFYAAEGGGPADLRRSYGASRCREAAYSLLAAR